MHTAVRICIFKIQLYDWISALLKKQSKVFKNFCVFSFSLQGFLEEVCVEVMFVLVCYVDFLGEFMSIGDR